MYFRFKQFDIKQAATAMKVGTDAVLLGAWVPIAPYHKILDVGAGTGLLSLMLAQRCPTAMIDAVEIDGVAYAECVENFTNSNWAVRLRAHCISFQDFVLRAAGDYDLIISNPPFYRAAYKSGNEQRDRARFTDGLSFAELVEGVAKLLAETGYFAVILPYSEEAYFMELAQQQGLYPQRLLRTRGNATAPLKRSLILFAKKELAEVVAEEFVIEQVRGEYTEAYKALTRDFYLKF